jgi:hydrogenase maturation protein HypF
VTQVVGRRVRVSGTVQGVGFRPFVHRIATGLGLAGWVGNDAQGVVLEVEGPGEAVAAFLSSLERDAPPLAVVEQIDIGVLEVTGHRGFDIVTSAHDGGARQLTVPPDTATCDACLAEVRDPADRRYRYPFANCTECGPRFTVVTGVPYDRPRTTMAPFPLCGDCDREYHDPADRRFHAQPVCCPACGPTLRLLDAAGTPLAAGDAALAAAVERLAAGDVLAVKGLGGYHLAARAADEAAVAALRSRKHREDKPFAVLAADLDGARVLAEVDDAEAALLSGPRRPIVLLRRRAGAPLAAAVAPGNRWLGVLLPYTPLHHLLVDDLGEPIVLTSGNVSDEPISYVDADALERLAPIADAFVTHDRAIATRVDDSVARVMRGAPLVLRRARGFVPEPLSQPVEFRRPVLAVGAELKSTVCLAAGHRALVSHHLGDLENYETLRAFTEAIDHLQRLLDVRPEVIAHDLHPEYLSTKHALEQEGVALSAVQHHHAHVASCMADNGVAGPVIGVAFDGLGYGDDGTLWGGELLVADLTGYQRAGHLAPIPLPGGAAAIRSVWRMAAAYLDGSGGDAGADLAVAARNAAQWDRVLAMARAGVASPLTSSAGRLFDAVAAIVGVRDEITYEGQAAIELEQLADPAEPGSFPLPVDDGERVVLRGADLVAAAADAVRSKVAPARVAMRFHRGLAQGTCAAVRAIAARTGLRTVALSGGVFQNVLLLDAVAGGLEAGGFEVLVHRRVPPNDGGISLGQAAVAGARDRVLASEPVSERKDGR